jgi:flagellin-like protein
MQKGISPVIATILLLLITVAIVGIGFTFFSRMQQTTQESVEKETQQKTAAMSFTFLIDSISQNIVYIRNTGARSITDLSFYADGAPVGYTGPAALEPGSVGTYTLNPAQFNAFAGQNVDLTTVGSSGFSQAAYVAVERIPEPVVWTNAVGVAVSGNNLTKTAASGWNNAGASSAKQITGNGYIEYTLPATVGYVMFGLNDNDLDNGYSEINYAIYTYPTTGKILIYENGITPPFTSPSYAPGDVLRISIDSGVVRYWRNGVLMYISAVPATQPMRADTSIYRITDILTNAMMYGDLRDIPQYAMYISGVNKNIVNITNTGTMALSGFSFMVNGVYANYSGPSALNPNTMGTFYVNDSIIAMQPDPTTLNVTATGVSVQQSVCFYCAYYAGYWKFDDGSGTKATDSGPYGYNGTLCNGVTCGVQGPLWVAGYFGNALDFDGIPNNTDGDWVDVPSSPATALDKTVTVSAWIYPRPLPGSYYFIRRGFGGDEAFHVSIEPGSILSFGYYNGTSFRSFSTAPGTITYYTWSHVAVVRNYADRTIKFYINGNPVSSATYADNPMTNSARLGLGGHIGSTTQKFNGTIDEVKILNAARSMTTA